MTSIANGLLSIASRYHAFQATLTNSSTSAHNSCGFSMAAKCPPVSCLFQLTRFPVVATQLMGTGINSFGNQLKPIGFLLSAMFWSEV